MGERQLKRSKPWGTEPAVPAFVNDQSGSKLASRTCRNRKPAVSLGYNTFLFLIPSTCNHQNLCCASSRALPQHSIHSLSRPTLSLHQNAFIILRGPSLFADLSCPNHREDLSSPISAMSPPLHLPHFKHLPLLQPPPQNLASTGTKSPPTK
jgi:hypothetical protein